MKHLKNIYKSLWNPCKYCLKKPTCSETCIDFEEYDENFEMVKFILIGCVGVILQLTLYVFLIIKFGIITKIITIGIALFLYAFSYYLEITDLQMDNEPWGLQIFMMFILVPMLFMCVIIILLKLDEKFERFKYKYKGGKVRK